VQIEKIKQGEVLHREDYLLDLASMEEDTFSEKVGLLGKVLTRESECTITLDLMESGPLLVVDFGGQEEYLSWNRAFLARKELHEVFACADQLSSEPGNGTTPPVISKQRMDAMANEVLMQLEDLVARVPDAAFMVVISKAELLGFYALKAVNRRLAEWLKHREAFAEADFELSRPEADASSGSGNEVAKDKSQRHRSSLALTEIPVARRCTKF